MFVINTSKNTLIKLAAFVWIVGGIVLFLKGYSLLKHAFFLSPNIMILIVVLIIAFAVGLINGKYIMSKFCRKNISRIDKIISPKIHQFFELKFFIFLTLMILTGFTLSKLAEGSYLFLLAVGCLDLVLSTALLTSTSVFFKQR